MRIATALALFCSVVLAGGAGQAGVLLGKGDYERAAEAARKLTKKDPANVEAWLVYADAQLKLVEPAEAWDAMEKAIEANPTDARLNLKLGDVFIAMAEEEQRTSGDGTAITNYYLDAERMYDEALAKDPKSVEAVFGKARANFFLSSSVVGTLDKAKQLVAECLEMDKEFGKAHALQAFMLYGEKNYAAAADKYAVAVKLDDSDPLDMVRFGHCYFALGEKDKAKAAYIAALKRHPTNDTPIRSGLYYLANRNWREAGPLMADAAEGAPNSAPVWYYLGYTRFLDQDWDAAAESFGKAIALAPKDSNYVYFLGYALEKKGDGRGALGQYRKALQINSNNVDAAGRFELLIRNQGDFDAVEKGYEELARLAPEQGFIFNDYGLVLRNWAEQRGAAKTSKLPADVLRRLKRSGEIYELAAKLVPEDPQVQSDTGLMFEFYPAIRDDEKAKRYFTRSLELSEYTYRDAFDGLNRLCQRCGDWETLLDYAEGVIGALERGGSALAPVGASAPQALGPQQTAALLARAKAAAAVAKSKLG